MRKPQKSGRAVKGRQGGLKQPPTAGEPRERGLGLFAVRKREVLDAFERKYFARLNREAGGNLSEMARMSGLSRPTIREYLERLGLRARG